MNAAEIPLYNTCNLILVYLSSIDPDVQYRFHCFTTALSESPKDEAEEE